MIHHRLYHHAARGLIGLLSTLVAIVYMCVRASRRSRRVRRGTIGVLGAMVLWGCGGGGPTSTAVDEQAATGEAGALATPGVTCAVASGDYVGCDGPAHPYAIGFWAVQESPSAPAVTDAGLVQWSCWEAQTTNVPAQHACPTGNACDVWRTGPDGGIAHELGTCR